ncbi:hypothetical protein M9Y10_044352 [Tritrichomonas musculus]|uniref:Uncharacterized protein n=1 Tax=Tritrichomonas musculus TaxID=1915356 RepID=A0ABR2GNI7_9EUKA
MTGTIREKLINFDSSKYRESKENDGTTVFEIRDQNNPTFNFEASYSSMTLTQKIKTSIIVPSSFLVSMNQDKFLLALPLGMLLRYFLPESNNCSGVVTIFARYQDIEKEALENNKNEKRYLEQKIIEEKNELKRINKSMKEDTKKLLINHNEELIRNIKELQIITKFVRETLSKLNEKCENETITNLNDKLAFYYQICCILYDESEQKESILNFRKVYEIMKNAKPKDQNINTIEIIDEFKLKNVNYLFPLNFDKTIKYFM